MDTVSWYLSLQKPWWAPAPWLFGPVWTVLYILIVISFGTVLYKVFRGELPAELAVPLLLNLVTNLIFTPIQFGLKNNILALVDILLVLGTLVWSIISIYPFIAWTALVNIPYLLWVVFASMLQISVTWLNR
jgi:tryptophan-rich sensory protein